MVADAPMTVGRYVLHTPLAQGGMATIHLGRMIGPGGFARTVAIKRLHEQFAHDASFVAGLLEEARISARIVHPNVVPTLDVVATERELLLVMEYVHGESLSRLIRASIERNTPVPLPIAIGVIAGALHGLHAAHEATSETGAPLGIVHRDVSPQNIMVGVDGVARVLDFGIAKAAGRLQDTMSGHLKGKLAYMAPEQVSSEPLDRRTDVFAASIVLWELLAQERLFSGDSEAATVGNILHRAIDPPSKHARASTPEIDAIVLRGLSRDPRGRFATAKEMAVSLESAIAPASSTKVGEWVATLAEETLSGRTKRLREIESATSEPAAAPRSGPNVLEIQEMPTVGPTRDIAAIVARRLGAYLGPHTARVAVKTFAMKALGRAPHTLTAVDISALMDALRPMLRTFIGRTECDRLLAEIEKEVRG